MPPAMWAWMLPELSVEAVQAIVIDSSVTPTTRTLVGVLGGVLSRRGVPAADADGARTANTTSTAQQARLSFMTGPPQAKRISSVYAESPATVLASASTRWLIRVPRVRRW